MHTRSSSSASDLLTSAEPATSGVLTIPPGLAAPTGPVYSIQIAHQPGAPCAECRMPTGSGPVGFCDGHPLCDLCLLESCADLGMVLALIAVVRQFAEHSPMGRKDRQDALEEIGAFARLYDRFAQRTGPARRIDPA